MSRTVFDSDQCLFWKNYGLIESEGWQSMVLTLLFFLTAILYASAGFGGGSTYNALLALSDVDYRVMPVIALLCNLIVVSGGTFRLARAGHLDLRRVAPWIAVSIPASWLGGFLHVPERVFIGLLGVSLFVAGLLILLQAARNENVEVAFFKERHPATPFAVGGSLGFLAGMTGIGGGIFLAPVLYLMRWGTPKKIAGACSFFILVNSIAGLAGQIMKQGDPAALADGVTPYWTLFFAVLAGGQIGSYLAAMKINQKALRIVTGLLILYAAGRLLLRWWDMGL